MLATAATMFKSIVSGHYGAESEEKEREAKYPEYAQRKIAEASELRYYEYESPGLLGGTKRLYMRGRTAVNKRGVILHDEWNEIVVGDPGEILNHLKKFGKLGVWRP